MSCDAWLEFHRELAHVLSGVRGHTDSVTPDAILLRNGSALPLRPLVEQCHGRPRADWRSLIARFVRRGVELVGGAGRLPARPASIDLRVRLVPSSPIDRAVLDSVGARRVTDHLAALVVLPTSRGLRVISEHDAWTLGWDVDEMWAGAWRQTGHLEAPDEIDSVEVAGVEIVHLFGAGELTASLVVALERFVGPIGEHGALVAVPCDHTVLVHPIQGSASRQAVGTLVPIVRRLHADGPGSLTPQVYWWRAGRLTWIPAVFGGDTNEIYLPAGLADVLA